MSLKNSIASLSELMDASSGPQITMLECHLIECRIQVRTEFNDETLQELADEIKARGVEQPVKVRPTEAGRYLLIFGERRLRATRLAGLETIPAIIAEMTDAEADESQFMENIHREDLSPADLAAAIGRRYEQLKAQKITNPLDVIAGQVKKSKSWVSKHLAAATKLHAYASNLLRDGHTQDIELLLIASKCLETDWTIGSELIAAIRAGSAGRKEAREALAKAKELAEEIKKKETAPKTTKPIADLETKPEKKPVFSVDSQLEDLIYKEGVDIGNFIAGWSKSERKQIDTHLHKHWQRGADAATQGQGAYIAEIFKYAGRYGDDHIVLRSMLAGGAGEPYDLPAIVTSTRTLIGID